MIKLTTERWRRLRPDLEALLELSEHERAAWLAAKKLRDADAAAELRGLLQDLVAARVAGDLESSASACLHQLASRALAGRRFGNYELVAPVGQGGMGSVWTAQRRDGHFEGKAAIKLLNAAIRGPEAAHRFLREGRLLARLSHPNIARLLDAGIGDEEIPYLVLEYVEGAPIDEHCDRMRLTLHERITLFLGVAAAVEHSHTHLIVHRDIKPANVLVGPDGRPRLLDFGIAGLAEDDTGVARTRTLWGARAMTLQYAAPEQLRGEPVTTRTDVYSLGVLLYSLCTGRHPTGLQTHASAAYIQPTLDGRLIPASAALVPREGFTAADVEAIAGARSSTASGLRKTLSGDLETILGAALKSDPRERYASAAALAADLRRYLDARPVSVRPDSPLYLATRFCRRHRLAAAAGVVATIALMVGGGVALWQAREAAMQARRSAAVHAFVLDLFGAGQAAQQPVQGTSTTASELLDRGAQALAGRQLDAATRSELHSALGRMYAGLGKRASALAQLEQHLSLERGRARERWLDDGHDVLVALLAVGRAAHVAGADDKLDLVLQEAEPLLARLGESHPALRGGWYLLNSRRYRTQDVARAANFALEAERAYRAADDPEGLFDAFSMQTSTLGLAGRLAEHRRASDGEMATLERYFPGDDKRRTEVLLGRSILLFEQYAFRAALATNREALQAALRGHGESNPATASTRRALVFTLRASGQLDECVRESRTALQAIEKSAGRHDGYALPLVLATGSACLRDFGLLEEAIAWSTRAVELAGAHANPNRVAAFLLQLAESRLAAGDLAAAEAAVQRAAQLASAPDMVPAVAAATARLRLAQQRPREALAVLAPHMRGRLDSPRVEVRLMELPLVWAEASVAARDAAAARAVEWLRVWAENSKLREEAPLVYARVLAIRANGALAEGQPDEAVQYRREALALRESRLSPDSPVLAATRAAVQLSLGASAARR